VSFGSIVIHLNDRESGCRYGRRRLSREYAEHVLTYGERTAPHLPNSQMHEFLFFVVLDSRIERRGKRVTGPGPSRDGMSRAAVTTLHDLGGNFLSLHEKMRVRTPPHRSARQLDFRSQARAISVEKSGRYRHPQRSLRTLALNRCLQLESSGGQERFTRLVEVSQEQETLTRQFVNSLLNRSH
jgi:hypothetical protein